jgi:hypothetical protein
MKKFTLYRNMVASWATAVALTLALSAGLSSCSKDEDNDKGSDTELYKPSKDMTQKEILALFKEVSDKMATVRKISAEGIKITTNYEGAKPEQYVVKFQEDIDAKKSIEILYAESGEKVRFFRYIDNLTAFFYDDEGYGYAFTDSYKISDAYWNRIKIVAEISFENFYKLTWKVEDDAFVGNGATETIKISLTTSKKVRTLSNFKEATTNQPSTKEEYTYTYSANPTPPSGFNLSESEFPPASQDSFTVVWGKELGSSIFYVFSPGNIDMDEIIECAPKVPGKKPVLYKDSNFTQLINQQHYVNSDNSTIVYVKWEDE